MELLTAFIKYFFISVYITATVYVCVRSFEKPDLRDPYKLAFIFMLSLALAVLHVYVEAGC